MRLRQSQSDDARSSRPRYGVCLDSLEIGFQAKREAQRQLQKQMYESGEGADWVIQCGEKEFQVHKRILMADSEGGLFGNWFETELDRH